MGKRDGGVASHEAVAQYRNAVMYGGVTSVVVGADTARRGAEKLAAQWLGVRQRGHELDEEERVWCRA